MSEAQRCSGCSNKHIYTTAHPAVEARGLNVASAPQLSQLEWMVRSPAHRDALVCTYRPPILVRQKRTNLQLPSSERKSQSLSPVGVFALTPPVGGSPVGGSPVGGLISRSTSRWSERSKGAEAKVSNANTPSRTLHLPSLLAQIYLSGQRL